MCKVFFVLNSVLAKFFSILFVFSIKSKIVPRQGTKDQQLVIGGVLNPTFPKLSKHNPMPFSAVKRLGQLEKLHYGQLSNYYNYKRSAILELKARSKQSQHFLLCDFDKSVNTYTKGLRLSGKIKDKKSQTKHSYKSHSYSLDHVAQFLVLRYLNLGYLQRSF